MKRRLRIGLATLAAACLCHPSVWAQTSPPGSPLRTATVLASSSYLGIRGKDIDGERAEALNLQEVRGVEVTMVVEDSPAAKAGFLQGDVVWEYKGHAVEGFSHLNRLVQETPAGRQVRIVVWRNGAFQTLTPTLEPHASPGWQFRRP